MRKINEVGTGLDTQNKNMVYLPVFFLTWNRKRQNENEGNRNRTWKSSVILSDNSILEDRWRTEQFETKYDINDS